MSSFAASDNSPLMVLVSFLGDTCLSSRNPASLSLAIKTGLPPTVEPDRGCATLSLGGAPPLPRPAPLKVLSCLGRVLRLTTPPRPTFRITFLLGDAGKFLDWPDNAADFLGETVDSFFLVVSTTCPLVVLVMVMPPPLVVFTSSCYIN